MWLWQFFIKDDSSFVCFAHHTHIYRKLIEYRIYSTDSSDIKGTTCDSISAENIPLEENSNSAFSLMVKPRVKWMVEKKLLST